MLIILASNRDQGDRLRANFMAVFDEKVAMILRDQPRMEFPRDASGETYIVIPHDVIKSGRHDVLRNVGTDLSRAKVVALVSDFPEASVAMGVLTPLVKEVFAVVTSNPPESIGKEAIQVIRKRFVGEMTGRVIQLEAPKPTQSTIERLEAAVAASESPRRKAKAAEEGAAEEVYTKYELRKSWIKAEELNPHIVAIGSSTGGPKALVDYFKAIGPLVSKVPFVLTQHMPEHYTKMFAVQLTTGTGIPTKEPEEAELLKPGVIYLAPGGSHLRIVKGQNGLQAHLDNGPPENFCKPAVDPMLRSVRELHVPTLVVILTGMGKDGLESIKDYYKLGTKKFLVLAQDESSSVVWGMPGAIIKEKLANYVGAPNDLGTLTARIIKGNKW